MKPIIYNLSNIRPPLTGVGRYAIELIRQAQILRPNIAAVKKGQLHTEKNLIALLRYFDSANTIQSPPKISQIWQLRGIIGNIPFSRAAYRTLDEHQFSKLSKPLIKQGASYHDLNYSLSPKSGNNVSTVYDLSHVVCPETHPGHRVNYLNAYFEKLQKGACHIIAISHTIKSELIERYGICETRVHMTHLAADTGFQPRSASICQAQLGVHKLSYKKYVLCVGTLEPRKNFSAVLAAYESLDNQLQKEFPLVMVGPQGWKSSALGERIKRLKENGVVKHLGFVPQADLPILYAGAAVFVYPSLYEGFGLPVLEAMQSGCPCITSNTGALAEVSSDGAIQVDPQKSDDIAQQLEQLLCNAELSSYYVKSGQQRAKNFSWAKTVSETCKIYDSL